MRKQHTIKKTVESSGIGLHSGEKVTMRLLPAPIDTGIVFLKRSGAGVVSVKASGEKVVATQLCTSIGDNGTSVRTVEHLMSTLSGLEIDNLFVEIDSSELPILDGSAEPFISLIFAAGIIEQDECQREIRITHPIKVRDGEKYLIVKPATEGLRIDFTIQFDVPVRIFQTRQYTASPRTFMREIARARTFGFLDDVEAMRSMGLAKGGSLDNAVVISQDGVLNPEGLRYTDEFIRHKILDLIGDLALLGKPLIGHVEAYCTGHQLNTALVSKILQSPNNWEMDQCGDGTQKTYKSTAFESVTVPASSA